MVRKRSITIKGHATSVTLEDPFWIELNNMAQAQALSLAALVAQIDSNRSVGTNLASAIRVYVLDYIRSSVNGRKA